MSGAAKRRLYSAVDWILWLGAIAGCMLLFFLLPESLETGEFIAGGVLVACIALRIPTTLHELGHVLAGLCSGFGVRSFTLSLFRISKEGIKWSGFSDDFSGISELYPKRGTHIRGKVIFTALAGGGGNLAVGAALLALSLALPYSPVLLFFAMFSLFCLGEGLRALWPATLPEGKTDGELARSFLENTAEARVNSAVLAAEGILFRKTFSSVPRELLFDVPVVREDDPAFFELLRLRLLFLLDAGEREEARDVFGRLRSLKEYFPEEFASVSRYEPCLDGVPLEETDGEAPFGIRKAEEKLSGK